MARPRLAEGKTFDLLVEAARSGARCPTRQELGARGDHVQALALQGRILVEVYGRNWRVVTIQDGPHKGAKTAPYPVPSEPGRPRRPYLVVGRDGVRCGFAAARLRAGPRERLIEMSRRYQQEKLLANPS